MVKKIVMQNGAIASVFNVRFINHLITNIL
jgi:hypothetical protein